MEESAYQLSQHELEVHEVMKVHQEERVFPSHYPCSTFMIAAGIMQDFQTLLFNAGLEYFAEGEPPQYVKLTMSVVQDFRFSWSTSNPMVHYKIYNKSVDLPLDVFCTAIRVPQWGSLEKIRGQPRPLLELYEEICQGRSFAGEGGKIQNIIFPSIRYFAFFITKCVLARKSASKLSLHDLAFLLAALRRDRTYNLGALIAFCLDINREKGGICGGLIASRLLAFHGVVPHFLDLHFPEEKLDLNAMIHHKFISPPASLINLTFDLTFFKKTTWRVVKTDRPVRLPAPLLFNLDRRNGWSLTEDELDAYIEEHPPPVHDEEGTEESGQPSNIANFPYEQPYYYDYAPSASSSREPGYDYTYDDPPAWGSYQSRN
jgi:hypothetical protein